MRISVCEFLRLMTTTNWCYLEPGLWISARWTFEARRDPNDPDKITITNKKSGKVTQTLRYFVGETHAEVRTLNKSVIAKLRNKK